MSSRDVSTVVRVVIEVNNQQRQSFIIFAGEEETTETIVIGDDQRANKLHAFMLLLSASKLLYGAKQKKVESLLQAIDNEILADSGLDAWGEIPF